MTQTIPVSQLRDGDLVFATYRWLRRRAFTPPKRVQHVARLMTGRYTITFTDQTSGIVDAGRRFEVSRTPRLI